MVKTKNRSLKNSRKNQKIYKMKGCAKTRKNYLGGSSDASLAYTGKPIHTAPNPFLAYTGKGGSLTKNINSAYPNTGPPVQPNTIFNNASPQKGGTCGGTCSPIMRGGGCGCGLMKGGKRMKGGFCPLCSVGFMVGGKRHRVGCKCSQCKKKSMKGGNPGIPYPDGLVGSSWTPSVEGWPGVDGIPGDRNYYAQNMYHSDPQTAMKNVGPNPPFLSGGKKNLKGGVLSNWPGQDLLNLGRQFQFGIGTAYNALAGYQAPTNPLPWKGQFPNTTF
jgi:hypothetical protein